MTVVGEFLRQAANLFSGEPGYIAIALVVSAVGLLWRLYVSRKRLSFEADFNAKIGIVPFATARRDDATRILTVFNSVSVVVIRVWNSGRATITSDDYRRPLRFAVRGRYVVDFRLSDPNPPRLRNEVDDDWLVSAIDTDQDETPSSINRVQLRSMLPGSLLSEGEHAPTADQMEARRQLRLPRLELRPGDEFRLVVCLREDVLGRAVGDAQTGYQFGGELNSGKIIDQDAPRRRLSVTRVLTTAVVVLTALLVVVVFWRPERPSQCASGDLQIVGSSAFAPAVTAVKARYQAECADARLTLDMKGSLKGVQKLQGAAPVDRQTLLAFSDDPAVGSTGQLDRREVAVLIFALVVNREAGVQGLTSEQVRQINAGAITNWSQLGGADLPIRMVGRDVGSGNRLAFERYVLGRTSEAPPSSDSCAKIDRFGSAQAGAAQVIRCERADTAELLTAVSRTPGAIGYATASAAADVDGVVRVRLDGAEPTVEYLQSGYPFWTVEYAYTNGRPRGDTLLAKFAEYLSTDAAARLLQEMDFIPCVRSDGSIEAHCTAARS